MSSLVEYLKAVRGELTHVSWPTRNQAIAYTSLVVAISIGVSLILGGFDYVFTQGLKIFLDLLT